MVQTLKKISDITGKVAAWIMFVYLVAVTLLAFVGVGFRAMGQSLSWNEELMRWLLIGIAYIGASVALKERSHIGIEFFILRMGPTLRKISIVIGYVAIVVFLLVLIYVGWKSAVQGMNQTGSILRVKMVYVKLNLPLGGLFMLIHMTYYLVGILTEKEETRDYVISGGHEV